jgi:hypothetical protein
MLTYNILLSKNICLDIMLSKSMLLNNFLSNDIVVSDNIIFLVSFHTNSHILTFLRLQNTVGNTYLDILGAGWCCCLAAALL